MDARNIRDSFKWLCDGADGDFSEERVYSLLKLSCSGEFDVKVDSFMYEDGTKELEINIDKYKIGAHLSSADELAVSTLHFSDVVDFVESVYSPKFKYNVGRTTIEAKNVEKVELRVYESEDKLEVIII